MFVSDLMTRNIVTITPETNLLECAKKMVRGRIGNLPIVKNKRLVGFISQRDILWALIKKSKKDLSKIKAIDISPKKIATLRPNSSIEEAFKKMMSVKFARLPVILEGELVGMITVKDILNFNPEFYPELGEYNQIKEEEEKLKRVKQAKSKILTDEGICEECGNQEMLVSVNGMAICESCSRSM